mgnify:CR=1 FL=1
MRSLALPLLLLAAACSTSKDLPKCNGAPQAATPAGAALVVWDDGSRTFFRFPGNQRKPAIYALHPDSREAALNTTTDGDVTIVHQTARDFVLRDGQHVACVSNQAWDQVGLRTGTLTASPDVERVSRPAGTSQRAQQ